MAHRFDPKNIGKLDNPERRKFLPPEKILLLLELGAGERMIDAGAGSGYFSLPASSIVGAGGSVTAVDVSEEMVSVLRERVLSAGARNIEIVHSSEYSFNVAPGSFDLALLCTVLHEIDDMPRFLAEVSRVLRPGGRIGVVEWRKKAMDAGPPLEDRIGGDEAVALLAKGGFTGIQLIDFNDRFYIVRGERTHVTG